MLIGAHPILYIFRHLVTLHKENKNIFGQFILDAFFVFHLHKIYIFFTFNLRLFCYFRKCLFYQYKDEILLVNFYFNLAMEPFTALISNYS